jgi:hypothetical protein
LLTLAALLSVLLVASLLSVDYLSTSDGPERILSGYLQNHLHDPGRGFDRFVRAVPTLTDIGFEEVFVQLEPHLGWRLAHQVTLCLIALVWAWGLMALAASLGERNAWLGLLGFGTALQWIFYMGQYSFQMGTGLGFLVLALAFRRREPSLLNRVLIATLLLTQCIAHVVAAVLTGAVLLVYAWLGAEPKRRLRALGGMAVIGLPAALLACWSFARLIGNSEAAQHNYPPTPLLDRLILLGRGFASGPWWRAWPPTILAAWVLVRPRWRTWDARARTLAVAGAVFAVCAAFLPLHLRSWEFFSVRFTPYAVAFLMVLAVPALGTRTRQVALVSLVVVYSGAAIAWSWHHHRTIRAASTDLLAGLNAPLKRQGVRLHLPLESPPGEDRDEWRRDVPYVTTTGHMGVLFAIEQGGVPAYSSLGLNVQGHTWRAPKATWMPPIPTRGFEWRLWEPKAENDPNERRAGLIFYLSYAPPFEDVILHARPGDAPLLPELGFVTDFQQGGLFIARFQGCALSLTAEAPETGPVPLLVTAGWVPQQRPVLAATIKAADLAGPIRLPRGPCGNTWWRIIYDMDGNGVPSSGDRACAAANPAAILLEKMRPAPDENRVSCSPGARL